jgi:hypothetical protein
MSSFLADAIVSSKIESASKTFGGDDNEKAKEEKEEKSKRVAEMKEQEAERERYLRERSEKRREENQAKTDSMRAKYTMGKEGGRERDRESGGEKGEKGYKTKRWIIWKDSVEVSL